MLVSNDWCTIQHFFMGCLRGTPKTTKLASWQVAWYIRLTKKDWKKYLILVHYVLRGQNVHATGCVLIL